MNHLAYLDPPIEVLAAGARLEMILSRLRSGRMRPFGADLPISHSSSEALLVDTQSLDKDTLGQFIDDFGQSLRPTLILGDPVFAGHFANAVFIRPEREARRHHTAQRPHVGIALAPGNGCYFRSDIARALR